MSAATQPQQQQQKARKVKKYTDDPGCKFIVIDDPWPGNKTGAGRDQRYWDVIGAWLFHVLGKKVHAEYIYSVNTRAEVIVSLPEDTDILPILGKHVWSDFLRGGYRNERASYIFEYDYLYKGNPATRQWAEQIPTDEEPPPHLNFPVKWPYPAPKFAKPHSLPCANIALPLPPEWTERRTPPPPSPPPLPPPEPEPEPEPESTFIPYERPAHHAFTTIPEKKEKVDKEEAQERPIPAAPIFVSKVDPYDEEEDALNIIKQEKVELSIKKEEPFDESGTRALVERKFTVNSYGGSGVERSDPRATSHLSHRGAPSTTIRVKPEPEEGLIPPSESSHSSSTSRVKIENKEYVLAVARAPTEEPSPELIAAHQKYLAMQARQAAAQTVPAQTSVSHLEARPFVTVKPEPEEFRLPPGPSTRRADNVKVKPEPLEAGIPNFPHESPVPRQNILKIKPEPLEAGIPKSLPNGPRFPPNSPDSRQNPVRVKPEALDTGVPNPLPKHQLPRFKKRTKEELHDPVSKRLKTEQP